MMIKNYHGSRSSPLIQGKFELVQETPDYKKIIPADTGKIILLQWEAKGSFMNEVKRCFARLAFYYLLLAVNILFTGEIVPAGFPLDHISSMYLLSLSVCLVLYYYLRISGRKKLRTAMCSLACMVLLLCMLRCIKYSVFGSTFILGRYTWYLYYIPILMIPTLMFYVALYIYAGDERMVLIKWGWVTAVTAVLILLVITNDFHQLVFRFQPEFENWDGDYSYGPCYTVIIIWEFGLYLTAVAVMVVRSNLTVMKNQAWIILIPFSVGITMMLILLTGKMPEPNGTNIIEFPEIFCFMVAGVLECCMQIGLIPTNENYRGLMQASSLYVQITDLNGGTVYKSDTAEKMTEEKFNAPDNTRTGEHTVLRRMDIPGGYGFWQYDVEELDMLSEKLQETSEALSREMEIIRKQNELKEKQKKIEQRSLVYDSIATHTRRQSEAISGLADKALQSEDSETKDRCRKQIALLGVCIKRYANLRLLSEENETMDIGELGISVAEVLRYLNICGIPGELINTAEGAVPSVKALTAFEAFETLLEENLSDLSGVFINLASRGDNIVFKLTLENLTEDPSESIRKILGTSVVPVLAEYEENTGYFSFSLTEGGDPS